MDWLERINRSMDYVEVNLKGEIDYKQAAQLACCSTYHFQRMFSFITNVTLSEYIRRRRLSLAAYELQHTRTKIIDLALQFGYESPEAFSRAFSKLHGVTPSQARSKGTMLKTYPRMSFHISIKGDSEMNYRIEEKDAFEVFGLKLQTNVNQGQCYTDIPQFWDTCEKDGRCLALAQAAQKKPNELLDAGVTYAHNPNGDMKYMIGCINHAGANTNGYTVLAIPRQTWAVFSIVWQVGDSAANLHTTWQRIYSEWFPSTEYQHADCDYDLELYFGDNDSEYGVEIWIPIVGKQ